MSGTQGIHVLVARNEGELDKIIKDLEDGKELLKYFKDGNNMVRFSF